MSSNASSKNPVLVPPEKRVELYRLTNPPRIAWPTVGLMLCIVIGVITVDIAAVRGIIPLWTGCLLNVVFMWPGFHVTHDAIHRAGASNIRLNDWIGRIGLFMFAPYVPLSLFRYSHMIHHRFTNDPQDPDHYGHGSWWTLPFRWMTIDFSYVWYNLKCGDPRGLKTIKTALPQVTVVIVLIAALVWFGFGREVVMLLLIPSRIIFGLISFVFLWLPHLDGDERGQLVHLKTAAGSSSDNLTAGSTIREGWEWLFGPLMQWHNLHLIHHLWPTTPSYNHRKVWNLMESELRARDLRIQRNFSLVPVFHPAGSTLVRN
jgi:fatty acid desaturase